MTLIDLAVHLVEVIGVVFTVLVIAAAVSKRARHLLTCEGHYLKNCKDGRVWLTCYDCGIAVGKGWAVHGNKARRDAVSFHLAPAGSDAGWGRPGGLRLLSDSSWSGDALGRADSVSAGRDVA